MIGHVPKTHLGRRTIPQLIRTNDYRIPSMSSDAPRCSHRMSFNGCPFELSVPASKCISYAYFSEEVKDSMPEAADSMNSRL
jgi:hypothetical protein